MESYDSFLVSVLEYFSERDENAVTSLSYDNLKCVPDILREAIRFKAKNIAGADRDKYSALVVQTGMYGGLGLKDDERLALMVLFDDISKCSMPDSHIHFCEKYSPEMPVFSECHKLRSLIRDDLLAVGSSKLEGSGQLLRFPEFLCRLPCIVPSHAALYQYLYALKNGLDLYLRIDPYDVSQSEITNIFEEAIIPADPKFINDLSVFRDEKKTAKYEVIVPDNIRDRIQSFLDYHNGYGRLEVVFKRHGSENILSFMAEELPRSESGRVLRGLCLHATCKHPPGTPWDDAVADHIDGAVNYYFDYRALERLDSDIFTAECDASCRTHLFRINNVKLSHLIPISKLFFDAQSLWEDWIRDQFRLKKGGRHL